MRYAVALILLLISIPAHALDLSFGPDVTHAKGKTLLELSYSGKQWPHWRVSAGFIGSIPEAGIEIYQTFFHGKAEAGLGINYSEANDIVSTDWKYRIRIAWNASEHWGATYLHFSNGQTALKETFLPHGENGINYGYNFVLGVYRFKTQ